MSTTALSRIVAMVGAAAVVMTITTAPVAAQTVVGNQDRPCFMVQSHWNDAEGPQPTCPDGHWKSDTIGDAQPVTSSRIMDFMP
jgi:hypothetical protein